MIPGIEPMDQGGHLRFAESVKTKALFPADGGQVPVDQFFLQAEIRSQLGCQLWRVIANNFQAAAAWRAVRSEGANDGPAACSERASQNRHVARAVRGVEPGGSAWASASSAMAISSSSALP